MSTDDVVNEMAAALGREIRRNPMGDRTIYVSPPPGPGEPALIRSEPGFPVAPAGCTCGHISCVCNILRRHGDGCRFRRAATCPVPIECDSHGSDVCAICDPCTCGAGVTKEDFRPIA